MKDKSVTYKKSLARKRRIKAIRKKIFGNEERPRLVVFRSIQHIGGQIINDNLGKTLVAFSSNTKDIGLDSSKKKTEQSFEVGRLLGEKAVAMGITTICFDRGGYLYHGRVKAFAEGVRKAGVKF